MNENQAIQNTYEETEIDLVEIFYLLWNNIFKIILCMVLGAVIAFSYSRFMITPLYKATSKMYINTSSKTVVDISDLQISNQLRGDYKELLTSRQLMEAVIKDLKLDYTPKQLVGMVSIGNPTDTRIITVTVTSPIPVEAADIANDMANRAKDFLPEIMKSEDPIVYEDALVPDRKSSPSNSRNTIIGALLGFVLMSGWLIIRYLMNDTIITPDDTLKYLGVQPLAVIPEGDLGSFNKKKKKSKSKSKKGKNTK